MAGYVVSKVLTTAFFVFVAYSNMALLFLNLAV